MLGALCVMKPLGPGFERRPALTCLVLLANLFMGMHCAFLAGSCFLGRSSVVHKPSSSVCLLPRWSLTRRCGSCGEDKNAEGSGLDPKLLTARISKAKSAARLLKLIGQEVDSKVFDHIHLAAAFSRLAKLKHTPQLITAEAGSFVWARMVARLRSMLKEDELSARSATSVFWAHGKLHEKVEELQHAAPEIKSALSATAARIADNVEEMTLQELSISLWAAARLQDTVPEVQAAVPVIAIAIAHRARGHEQSRRVERSVGSC